ncbi:MAG: hypothetical protein KJ558_04385 [Gammaproteobacteria bacterium]|nr:hypothetical protein [Gammaproteobacteria bacterium]MBU1654058.1 hypothetical protein [Gammaproteobacteria bacterium]MBU1961732.1 hypothetical protein [Gammaproteobacteria bacterium]
MAKAKERFKLPADSQAWSVYEAGRDGFWAHRALDRLGIENRVLDSASMMTALLKTGF